MKSTIEIWRDIKDYEGLYQVSNLGRVKSLDHYVKHPKGSLRLIKERILKLCLHKTGYLRVCLSKNNIKTYYSVHRLVAEAFKPNTHNYPTVDHINRIRTDNRVENLRWAPWELQQQNADNKDRESVKKSLSKPVEQYTLDMVFVAVYPSAAEAERQTGINQSNIRQCCKGNKNHSHAGGYIWKTK